MTTYCGTSLNYAVSSNIQTLISDPFHIHLAFTKISSCVHNFTYVYHFYYIQLIPSIDNPIAISFKVWLSISSNFYFRTKTIFHEQENLRWSYSNNFVCISVLNVD